MDNVVSLGVVRPTEEPPVESVIAAFEQLLEGAKTGRIRGVVAAMSVRDESAGYAIAGTMSPFPMIGVLEFLKCQLVDMAMDEEE